jgi:hypothetical protein
MMNTILYAIDLELFFPCSLVIMTFLVCTGETTVGDYARKKRVGGGG